MNQSFALPKENQVPEPAPAQPDKPVTPADPTKSPETPDKYNLEEVHAQALREFHTDGTIALIAARLIRNWQPSFVEMLGLKAGQAEMASQAGVDSFITETPSAKYDLIIEASGSSSRISESIRLLVRGGTLLLLGFTGSDVTTGISIDDVVNGDLNLLASFGYSRSAWKQTVSLLNSGGLDLTFLVTHRFALEDFAEAIAALESAPAPRGKIVLQIGS